MGCKQFTVHFNMGAWGAEVAGGSLFLWRAAQELYFNTNGEILLEAHAFRRLSMNHHATVPKSPRGPARYLLAGEAILDAQSVVTIGFFIKKVAKAVVEVVIGIVSDCQESIFYTEGVPEIFSGGVPRNFGRPVVQVFSIKKGFPMFGGGLLCLEQGGE